MVSITLNHARNRQNALGFSAATSARLVDISPASLSNAYRDISRLSSEKESELATVLFRLTELSDAILPFGLPENVDDLRRLLDAMESRAITAENVRTKILELFGEQQ